MKTAPFNLKKALAGGKVVTRTGDRVTDFKYFPTSVEPYEKVVGLCEGKLRLWGEDGRYTYDDHRLDLFMETQTTKRFLNVYKTEYGNDYFDFNPHKTKEEADLRKSVNRIRFACIEVEFEEGDGL